MFVNIDVENGKIEHPLYWGSSRDNSVGTYQHQLPIKGISAHVSFLYIANTLSVLFFAVYQMINGIVEGTVTESECNFCRSFLKSIRDRWSKEVEN